MLPLSAYRQRQCTLAGLQHKTTGLLTAATQERHHKLATSDFSTSLQIPGGCAKGPGQAASLAQSQHGRVRPTLDLAPICTKP